MNDSSDKSGTSSRWTALVDAHVNKQTYALPLTPFWFFTYRVLVKSTPVVVNGVASATLSVGYGGGSGATYRLPVTLLQTTYFRNTVFTRCRIDGIRYFCRSCVIVALLPEWSSLLWQSCIYKRVTLCFGGSRYGNLAFSFRAALWILPPHRM